MPRLDVGDIDLPYPQFHHGIDIPTPELVDLETPFGAAMSPLTYMTVLDDIIRRRRWEIENTRDMHQFFLAFLEPPATHRPQFFRFNRHLEVTIPIRWIGGWSLMQRSNGPLLPVNTSHLWVWFFIRSVKVGVANWVWEWRWIEVVVCPCRLTSGGE